MIKSVRTFQSVFQSKAEVTDECLASRCYVRNSFCSIIKTRANNNPRPLVQQNTEPRLLMPISLTTNRSEPTFLRRHHISKHTGNSSKKMTRTSAITSRCAIGCDTSQIANYLWQTSSRNIYYVHGLIQMTNILKVNSATT